MKNKGVFISIFFIICLGVFVTMSTRRFISDSQETSVSADNYQIQAFSSGEEEPFTSPEEQMIPQERVPEMAKARIAAAPEAVPDKGTVTLNTEEYKKKLKDIDNQIKKMKDSGIEPNTDSYKNMADYEYRLWDTELNTVYQAILTTMPEEETDSLREEEREWLKERDTAAHKAISKYNGGTIESLEYTASLADSTRTRVYALLENYGSYMDRAALNTSK